MSGQDLMCPRVNCHGEFEYLGDDGCAALYQCSECSETLNQAGVEELADDDGVLGALAQLLLEGESA